MARDSEITRRTAMKITGATAATALVAGCGGSGGDDDGGNGGDDNGGDDDSNPNGDGDDVIEAGTDIDLEAATNEWVGLAPSSIEEESNPTLTLIAGEDYTLGWSQGDGNGHNIEIVDENDEVVDDLSTDTTNDEEPDDQVLEFTASEEMAEYVCRPHESTGMRASIEVQEGNGGDENGGDENNESE